MVSMSFFNKLEAAGCISSSGDRRCSKNAHVVWLKSLWGLKRYLKIMFCFAFLGDFLIFGLTNLSLFEIMF